MYLSIRLLSHFISFLFISAWGKWLAYELRPARSLYILRTRITQFVEGFGG